MSAAIVVQVLHGFFCVLLQLLVVAAIILSFMFYCKFYCKFYCRCDPFLKIDLGTDDDVRQDTFIIQEM